MIFNDWVDFVGGVDEAAAVLEQPPRTVLSWYVGDRSPRPKLGLLIVNKTQGKVDFNGIYGPLSKVMESKAAKNAAKEKAK